MTQLVNHSRQSVGASTTTLFFGATKSRWRWPSDGGSVRVWWRRLCATPSTLLCIYVELIDDWWLSRGSLFSYFSLRLNPSSFFLSSSTLDRFWRPIGTTRKSKKREKKVKERDQSSESVPLDKGAERQGVVIISIFERRSNLNWTRLCIIDVTFSLLDASWTWLSQ